MQLGLGIFFLSSSILAFELISAQLVGFILSTGYSLLVISLAMLGLSFSASLLSCVASTKLEKFSRWLPALSTGLVLSLVVTFVGLRFFNVVQNEQVFKALTASHLLHSQLALVMKVRQGGLIEVGLLLALPYFVFGLILSLAMSCAPRKQLPIIYGFDLIGAAFGIICAYLTLDNGSFLWMLLLPISLSLVGMLCVWATYAVPRLKILVGGVTSLILLFVVSTQSRLLEPQPQPHSSTKDFLLKTTETELWHGWQSYGRVGLVRADSPGKEVYKVIIGNGEGQARLSAYPLDISASSDPVELLTAFGAPSRALILMAGAGWEMEYLDQITKSASTIRGVELNPNMRRVSLLFPDFHLRKFFEQRNIDYVTDEARSFMERDHSKYDVILYSWSGATNAYYTGSIAPTAQYLYTRESLQCALKHLTPDGYLVILNTKKSRIIAMLKSLATVQDLKNQIVLLREQRRVLDQFSMSDAIWDEDILLYKPSGFTEGQMSRLQDLISHLQMSFIYPGRETGQGYLAKLISAQSVNNFVSDFNREFPLEPIFIPEDDRPFIFSRHLEDSYLQLFGVPRLGKLALKAALISLLGLILILTPLFLFRKIPSGARVSYLAYFASIGFGFMFVEVGLINQLNLLVGNPGLALGLVLAGIITSSGLGSLASGRLTPLRAIVFCCLLIGYLSLFCFTSSAIVHWALVYPPYLRIALALALIMPVGFFMGLFFPYGLMSCQEENPQLIPLAWAVNGVCGTSAAAWSWALAPNLGFRNLTMIGIGFYMILMIVLLIRRRSGALS